MQCAEKTYSEQRKRTVRRENVQCAEKTYSVQRKDTVFRENVQCAEKTYSAQRKRTVRKTFEVTPRIMEHFKQAEKNTMSNFCATNTKATAIIFQN